MHRGEIWWAQLEPEAGIRPVLLVSREHAIQVRQLITIVQLTTRFRGLPSEVRIGPEEGVKKPSAVNCDVIKTIEKAALKKFMTVLPKPKMQEVNKTIKFALGLDELP